MLYRQLLEIYELLDSPLASGESVKKYLLAIDPEADVETYPLQGEKGSTDVIKIRIPGIHGKKVQGSAPTLGILGRLGGIGARPEQIGFVSDGDGCLCALAIAAKLLDMKVKGDQLAGDIHIATHICPKAPTVPHIPVPFMGSPINMIQANREEVDPMMDAVLSIDTTKGNRVINHRGFAISNTVKEGFILPVSADLVTTMEITTGENAWVFPLSTQDITPYGNGLSHLNSILQPATATNAPVVGVAITAESAVPGCATNASHLTDMAEACSFCLQTAIDYTRNNLKFYDEAEFALLKQRYGSMAHIQTFGELPPADQED